MKLIIRGGRIIDPASGRDEPGSVAVASGRIVALGNEPAGFAADRVIDAQGCLILPGLIDLAARLREPGHEHVGLLESEMAAAVAGGVTALVCPPDTDPVLDEPGLVEMLRYRAERLHQARVFPLGALTKGLAGEALTEMVHLAEAGCVGFGQADQAMANTQVLLRALQYASTFGYTVWLRPQDAYLGGGVAASGSLATRMGLPGVPVAAETIALHTIFELARATGARVHLCRLSSAAGVELVRAARAQGLAVTADVSVHSLHLTDLDIGYFDSHARLSPPLRQARDRAALRAALADGTLTALVSDHNPVGSDAKALPFGQAEPGATAIELLASLAHKWALDEGIPTTRAWATLTSHPADILASSMGSLQASLGRLVEGGVADVCVFDPQAAWVVTAEGLRSHGKHTPFQGYELPGRVRATLVGGHVAFERAVDRTA
jgi:dihydroorotase